VLELPEAEPAASQSKPPTRFNVSAFRLVLEINGGCINLFVGLPLFDLA
jgi:hypothetical protein